MVQDRETLLKSRLMTTSRIETIVDGIFAISMTLLVLSLEVPTLPSPVTDLTIQNYLWGILPNFYVYALSFFLLAVFWRINHVQFHRIKKADNALIWINVIWLMLVALVPFSTSLVGDYGNLQTASLFFNINMFFIAILTFVNWYYAANHHLLDRKLSPEFYKKSLRLNLVFPLVAVIAIVLSFVSPSWSTLAYILVIPLKRVNELV